MRLIVKDLLWDNDYSTSIIGDILDIIMPMMQLDELAAMILVAEHKQQYMIQFGV